MPPKVKVIQRPDRGPAPTSTTYRAPKPPPARLKLEIRRLPPGLTLTEFEETLGDEWKLGNGKIDWREYRTGKVKSPGKVPDQSRCYLHLKSETLVREFEQRFLNVVFHDKAGTHKNPDLKQLQPILGYAANQRTPLNAKPKADNRQGTIDQDPEFIAFLEAETQPIAKPAALDNHVDKEKEVIKSTPLIDDLREKKASKAKAAASKAEKEKKANAKGDAKDADKGKKESAKTAKARDEPTAKSDKNATKQAGKHKEAQPSAGDSARNPPAAPSKKSAQAKGAKTAPAQAAAVAAEKAPPTSPARQRQPRNNLDGIKKQLQKDLGVKPALTTNKAASSTPASGTTNALSITPAAPANPPTGPKQSRPAPATEVSKTKAYLKHANPSQGMTEVLIQQALSGFGEMVNVTIDPRKGTAIVVFKDNEGLKKAMEAKKVTVANGAVEILEFKERTERSGSSLGGRGGFRGGRGGRGGSRGGSNSAASTTAPASS